MIRILLAFLVMCAFAVGLAWFADRPGELSVVWLGHEVETTFLFAATAIILLCLLSVIIWAVIRRLFGTPAAITDFFRSRRQRIGYEALSKGIIAIGSGDKAAALTHAKKANKLLTNEPLTLLLKAQTAQLKGEMEASKNAYEAMLQNPDTEVLGLRGLYLLAQQNEDEDAEKFYAERAAQLKPNLTWASEAILGLHSAHGSWEKAEQVLEDRRRFKLIDKSEEARKKAVLLTARAIEGEDQEPEKALELALSAHKLAPELVPASVVAARILSDKGDLRKASRVLEKTWDLSPHPDIAEVYGAARSGDAPLDRLKRVKTLVKNSASRNLAKLAIAEAAVEAQAWDEALSSLEDIDSGELTMRACALTARAHEGLGDMGRAREWFSKAVRAKRDPVWVADGYVSDQWSPVSPITGELDAFEWKVPLERIGSLPDKDEDFEDAADLDDDIVEIKLDPKESPGDETPVIDVEPAKISTTKEQEKEDVNEQAKEGAVQSMSDDAPQDAPKDESPQKIKTALSGARQEKARKAAEKKLGEDLVSPPQPDDPGPDGPAEAIDHHKNKNEQKGFFGRLFGG